MNYRENLLRAYRFQRPRWIPIISGYPPLLWSEYDPKELQEIILTHKILFPNYEKGSIYPDNVYIPPDMIKGKPYTDGWGCVWETMFTGMEGTVTKHPLADWDNFGNFVPPDPEFNDGMRPIDWHQLKVNANKARKKDQLFVVGLPHGHTFLKLMDIRGYENLMFDMMDEHPNLMKLIKMVENFNLELIKRFINLQPDMIWIPEDLGMQASPMISPQLFRKYIKPSYTKIMKPIKDNNIVIHQHCDGYIMDLIDDMIEAGPDVINLQDLVNGIDNIQKNIKGRIAIDLDIDRQSITVNGNPGDIEELIHQAISKLGSKEGGLSLSYQPWPPTPIENIKATFDAMEKYCTYYQ